MTERQKFMAEIERICGGKNARYVLHDWELYFRLGTEPIMQERHIARLFNASDA